MGDFDPARELFPVIRNRHGLKLFVKLIEPAETRGNVYVSHGLSDAHDTAHMRALTTAFVRAGYRVVLWDASHSWGRSEGNSERASFYHHFEDLEDVVVWSESQDWYQKRFMLAGHSLGGMAAGTYAASHAAQVLGLVLVAPVVSGPALRRRIPLPLRIWWRWRGVVRTPGRGRTSYAWELMRSGWSYNLLAVAHRLTMPVLIVAAGRDMLIPPRLMRRLYRALASGHKQLEVVRGARHGFDEGWEAARLQEMVEAWSRLA